MHLFIHLCIYLQFAPVCILHLYIHLFIDSSTYFPARILHSSIHLRIHLFIYLDTYNQFLHVSFIHQLVYVFMYVQTREGWSHEKGVLSSSVLYVRNHDRGGGGSLIHLIYLYLLFFVKTGTLNQLGPVDYKILFLCCQDLLLI